MAISRTAVPKAAHAKRRVETLGPFRTVTAMALTLDQIVEEAQQWPDDVVAELVDRLMLARHG